MTLLGVDFGTTHSSIAGWTGEVVRCCPDHGEPRIPSVVHVPSRGDPLVGAAALPHLASEPLATATAIKRMLGRPATLRPETIHRVVRGGDGSANPILRGEPWSPVQLTAAILRHLRERAVRMFGESVTGAVFTVPVGSPRPYIDALTRSAQMAGLRIARLVAEPIAAMVAVGAHARPPGTTLLCDFGGGTLDCAVVHWDGRTLNPLAVDGDDRLGGDDFDDALCEAIAGAVFRRDRVDLHHDQVTWEQLRHRCELAKRHLSNVTETRVTMQEAYAVGGRHRDLDLRIERSWAEGWWTDLATRAATTAARCLRRAGLRASELTDVVMVGGTSRIPLVQRHVASATGREVVLPPDAELAVVCGAALIAARRGRLIASAA